MNTSDISLNLLGQKHNYIPLVWASTHCKLKMEKQDLQAEES